MGRLEMLAPYNMNQWIKTPCLLYRGQIRQLTADSWQL